MLSVLLALLVAAPGVVGGGVVRSGTGVVRAPAATSTLLAHYPFTSSGTFETDANTVSYVTWNGSALVDPYAVTTPWTMVGTVPQNVNSPLYPQGFAAASLKGAGPFNGSTHYARSNPNAIGSITGDFTACVAFKSAGAATETIFSTAGSTDADGYRIYTMSGFGSTVAMRWADGGHTLVTGNTTADVNVACWGRKDGVATTGYLKLNLGTTVSGSVSQIAPTTGPTRIGTSGSGTQSLNGAAFAQWVSLTPWSEALATKQIARFFGLTSTAGLVPTVTRTTTATNAMPDGTLWTWPAGVARIGCDSTDTTKCGLLVEPTGVNYVQSPRSVCKSGNVVEVGWNLANATCLNDTALDPSGTSSFDTVTTSANGGYVWRQTIVSLSTGPFVAGAFVAPVSGSSVQSVGGFCPGGTATATGCWRSDGGICSTGQETQNAFAYGTFSSAARMVVTFTCSVATTTPGVFFHDGLWNSTNGVGGRVWGLSLEARSHATSFYEGTRNADAISVANPLAATNPAKWCVDGTYTPEAGRAWTTHDAVLWGFNSTTDSIRTFANVTTGKLRFRVADFSTATSSVESPAPSAGAHRVSGMYAAAKDYRIGFDGAWQTVTAPETAGNGTAVAGYSQPIWLGSYPVAGAEFGGSIRDFKVWKGACR